MTHRNQVTRFVATPVWDRTTRWFHWINVICVITLTVFGLAILNEKAFGVSDAGKIALKTLHTYTGYVFSFNLGWRIIWGFVGGHYSRWAVMLPFGVGFAKELRLYVRGIFHGKAPVHLGHNPLGKLMILLLFPLLFTQAMTGLILAGTDLYKPPFGSAVAHWVTEGDPEKLHELVPGVKDNVDPNAYAQMRSFRKPIVTVHLYAFYILVGAALLHILGVVVSELRERNGLVSAMITGTKVVAEPPGDD
jgi:cytochrome b